MKRFVIILLFILLPYISFAQFEYRFAVLGDSRNGEDIFSKALQQISALQPTPAFVIHTGDFINGYSKNINRIKSEWQSMLFEPLHRYLRCGINFYPVPGNHDISGSFDQYQYYLENVYPYTYYYFVYNNTLFLILSSEEIESDGTISEAQFRWVKRILTTFATEKFIKHRFVFVHRPLYPYKAHLRDSLNQDIKVRDNLMRLFNKNKVEIIFCGHIHLFHLSKHNGIIQIITAGAGAHLYSSAEGEGIFHFVYVDINDKGMKIYLKDLDKKEPKLVYEK